MRKTSRINVSDSTTRLGPDARGAVVLAGSHCGLYAAYTAARAGVRAVILNDGGIGRDRAGIAGLPYLQALGLPGAAVSHRSSRIGDGQDSQRRGVIAAVNDNALKCGVYPGLSAQEAAHRFAESAPEWNGILTDEPESRVIVARPADRLPGIALLDSVSLVEPSDAGQIIVTGSHGGLLGGRPETASKVDVFAALFNDADFGIDDAGLSRLPTLDARGIAAATVSAWSARIGDGRSSYQDGVITRQNDTARRFGGEIGIGARVFVDRMVAAKSQRAR